MWYQIIMMWREEYKKENSYWGIRPEKGLREVLKYAQKGIALDIGTGEGRNSIFLARNGFEVEAIDKIPEGLNKCKKIAKKYNLSIKTRAVDIRKFRFKKNKYSLVLSINALDFLKFAEVQKIVPKIKKSLKKGGAFYLSVFSTKDPAFKRCKKKFKMTEKNTFYLPKLKTYRHFYESKELLNLLKGFKILKIEEKKKEDFHNKSHFHWIIKYVGIKK